MSIKNYYSPTPKKWRQWGDFFLVLIPVINTGIAAAPNLNSNERYWISFVCSIVLVFAKFATNTKKEL